MSIHIERYGEGVPLVLFHGWGFSGQMWHGLVPSLEAHYQLFLVDLPGFGRTPMMSWEHFCQALVTCLPDKFALGGWSMGGLFALRLALERPQSIQALFTLASAPYFMADSIWPGISATWFSNFWQKFNQNPLKTWLDFLREQGEKESIINVIIPPQGLEFGLQALQSWDLREQLTDCTLPICFIFCSKDKILSPRVMQTMQIHYPRFHYHRLDNATHAPFSSHQDEITQLIMRFIK